MGLSDKIEKAKSLDENIIDLLKGKAMDMELDESLARSKISRSFLLKLMCV